jgi:hypothetical protein
MLEKAGRHTGRWPAAPVAPARRHTWLAHQNSFLAANSRWSLAHGQYYCAMFFAEFDIGYEFGRGLT